MPNQHQRRYCPVCWQYATRTVKGMVRLHMDSVGRDSCPYSNEPWDGCIQGPRKPRHRKPWDLAA